MADFLIFSTRNNGRLRYRRDLFHDTTPPPPPTQFFSQIHPRYQRPSVIVISKVDDRPLNHKKSKHWVRILAKLAGPRDRALSVLRSIVATQSSQPKTELVDPRHSRKRREGEGEGPQEMPHLDVLRGVSTARFGAAGNGTPHTSSPLVRPVLEDDIRSNSTASVLPARARDGSVASTIPEEKPVAAGNGVSISVNLAEPLLFLQGYDQNDSNTRNTAMLRGSLHLKVQRSAKLKAVTLRFRGTAITRWPEGIPPKKIDFEERDTLMSHTWPFFNAQFPMAEGGSGADHVQLAGDPSKGNNSPYKSGSPVSSTLNITTKADKRMTLQSVPSKSFDKSSDSKPTASVAQKGYRLFHPGDYIYNFELPLDSRLPESIDVDLGSVKYELEASVERAGAFRANLLGTKEVTLIRAPTEGSLEQVEPIAISRNWEDQLHYDIVISGKSHPLGSRIPIAFKLTPLAKVQCHRVKVFVTENIEYFCSNKRVHRVEPTRKVLLYEKRADGTTNSTFPGSTQRVTAGGGVPFASREAAARGQQVEVQDPSNLLGRLEADSNVGPTEMEMSVQLPGCQQLHEKDRLNMLNFDTTYQNVQVHHWIKIVMRLSRPDADDPNKRRHFEISIDSPFHILSCRANQANTALPAYSSPESGPGPNAQIAGCNCPGAPQRRISPNHLPTLNSLNVPADTSDNSSRSTANTSNESSLPNGEQLPMRPRLARPPTAHVHGSNPSNGHLQRPIHMLRAPSFNPPAFEDEQPPPPLATPPPNYGEIASPTAGHGLADYFTRRAAAGYSDEEDSDEERSPSSWGRVNLPLTPGGRVNRSMDMGRREWASLNAHGR